ncbi:MAG: AAA family ATPase [Caldilineaceae bacterium]|nr:AAA family ATPase [Caldilineaceae bacterium]
MSTVSVSRIVTTNYKNLRLGDGIDFGALTVLLGSNGSGKSNLIALFEFLQQSIAGARLDDYHGPTSLENAIFSLGGARILDGTLSAPANVVIEYRFPFSKHETTLHIELLVQSAHRQVIVVEEFLGRDLGLSKPFFFYLAHGEQSGGSGNGVVSVFDEHISSDPLAKSHFERIIDMPVNDLALSGMPRLLEKSKFSPEATPLYGPRATIMGLAATSRFYNANDMNLERIRFAEPKLGQSESFLSSSGENLALVLHSLVQKNFEFEESLNRAIQDILPKTRKVRAVTSGRLSLTVEWHVDGYDEPFFLSDMSDGTVRMLCWAVILHSPFPPRFIVIDEPELGIHPAWMPVLAEWIKGASQRSQIVVATHSPDLLDHFTDQLDEDGFIYVFGPATESPNHFSPHRLSKEAVSGWLDEGWQLGDLYRVGNPAVGGWPW